MLARYQQGLSPLGVLLVVLLFAFFLVSGLKLVPHYLDFSQLKTIYQNVNDQPNIDNMSPQDVQSAISKALTINSMGDFNIKDSTVISRESGHLRVGLDYEVREQLFANINVVLTFEFMPE